MGERGRWQPTRGASWVFNVVPDLENKFRAACFRGWVFESTAPVAVLGSLRGSRASSQPLSALVSLSVKQEKLFPPWGGPGDWSCWLQSSVKHGTVGFVSGSWLRFGARAVRQGPSLFLSSPLVACDIEAKSRIAFASSFIKAAEHPTTPWVTPVGMSHIPPARPYALGHGVGRMEGAAGGECIMVLCCSKEIAVPRQGQRGCLSASCFWSQEQRGSQVGVFRAASQTWS